MLIRKLFILNFPFITMKLSAAELIKKYNIDLEYLKREQIKLARTLEIKDSSDFSDIRLIAGIDSEFNGNEILSCVVVLDLDFNVVEQVYAKRKMKFPYISGMRAYREMPAMLESFYKLSDTLDLIFIKGHGITHPRLGLASHFSLSSRIPTIGITESLMDGFDVKGDDIFFNGNVVGKVFQSKKGSRPLYVSPGNLISIKTALELTKKFIQQPHKYPEPLHLAGKYGKRMRKEIFSRS